MYIKWIFAVALMALAGSTAAVGADNFYAAGMKKIQDDLGSDCPARLKNVGQALVGNNGLREEQWFVATCQGVAEYWVTYYPPEAFPDRTTHLETRRVTHGVR